MTHLCLQEPFTGSLSVSHLNPIYAFTPYSFKMKLKAILLPKAGTSKPSILCRFVLSTFFLYISFLSRVCPFSFSFCYWHQTHFVVILCWRIICVVSVVVTAVTDKALVTGCGLQGRVVMSDRQLQVKGPPSLLSSRRWVLVTGGNSSGAWSWSLASV
jgi:hypothetical protein